jgi:Icc protein
MIEIDLGKAPYHELPFLNAAPGRRGGAVREHLPFLHGRISGLPRGSPPLVAMGDLQGRIGQGEAPQTLLGCGVAEELPNIHATAGLPAPAECLGLLAGDFYSVPDAAKRGGTGDVTEVWNSLRGRFAGIAGVLGNHDIFGRAIAPSPPAADCLDGRVIEIRGLRVGGVSGIVGSPDRTNRRSPDEFAEVLLAVLVEAPHIVVLHAPPRADDGAPGEESIAAMFKSVNFAGLIVCGHVHWRGRVQRCGNACCLNVDGAVVTLNPSLARGS